MCGPTLRGSVQGLQGAGAVAIHELQVRPHEPRGQGGIAPGGLAFVGDYLWLTGTVGEDLWRIKVGNGGAGDTTPYFAPGPKTAGKYGALRAVGLAPDGRLWLGTSNTDRRKAPKGDDRLLLVQP